MTRRYLVTAALPYANNKPHLGHVAGVYLPADIYVRFLRMTGNDVVFVCGSDDHGVPITISAEKEGCEPQEVVSRYRAAQEEGFTSLGIEFDIYSGTSTCPGHGDLSSEFFLTNLEKGNIEARDTMQFYCQACRRFLPDRYVEGICPLCQAPDARGDQCDSCGKGFEQTLLTEPRCVGCGETPETRNPRQWFFLLDRFEDALREWLESREGWRENVKNFALGLLREGLPPRSITRDLSWGVPVPLEEADGKVLYVWFDAPVGYISFTRELFEKRGDPEGWRPYWQDEETSLVHFLGKDNILFHAVIWPAMLLGRGDFNLPANIPANEFLNFKGEKFSKSKGHGVTAEEILALYSPDRVRYYLTAIAPENRDTSFTWEDFIARNNDDLSDVVGNLCHRVFVFTDRYFDSKVPAGGERSEHLARILEVIAGARDSWRTSLEACRIREAVGAVVSLAREGNRIFDAAQPWKSRKEDAEGCGTDIASLLELVRAVALLLTPFLPESGKLLRGAFPDGDGLKSDLDALGERTLAGGDPIAPPGIVFPRLELAED